MNWYRKAKKKKKEYLNAEERKQVREKFGDPGCSFAKDKGGYYCFTHRARSDSYSSINDIPKSVVEFIEGTG